MAKSNATITDLQARIAAAEAAEKAGESEAPSYTSPSTDYSEGSIGLMHSAPSNVLALPTQDLSTTMTMEHIALPRIKLGQGQSKAVQNELVRSGQWYLSPDTLTLGTEFDVIFLNWKLHNAYFETGQGLLCRSYDLVQGVGNPGIECGKCALSQWAEDGSGGNRIPPKCKLFHNYTAYVIRSEANDESDPLIGILSLGSTSTPAAKQINSAKAMRGGMTGPWYPYWYRIRSNKQEGRKGIFYVAQAQYGGKVEGELLERARDAAASLDVNIFTRSLEVEDEAA